MEPVDPKSIEAARRRGFFQGMNAALACAVLFSTGWTAYHAVSHTSELRQLFTRLHLACFALSACWLLIYITAVFLPMLGSLERLESRH